MSLTKITPKEIRQVPSVGGDADLAQYLQILPGAVFTVARSTERAVKEVRVTLSSRRESVEEPVGQPETGRREGTE